MAAELSVHHEANRLILVGELDTHTSPALEAELVDVADGAELTLDLAGVTFISSAGLTAILNGQRRLEETGGSLGVASPNPAVARMIELSGLTETFGLT